MPSHQDRISKQYSDLCAICLKYPNNDWDDIVYSELCDGCRWRKFIAEGNCKMPNENIQAILDKYPL